MIKFPFTSLQQLNLDWIMEQLHKILQFMPLNGVAGDVLQRNADGAAWMPIAAISLDIHSMDALPDPVAGNDELPIYDNSSQGNYKIGVSDLMQQAPVQSVNGQTGTVSLSIPDSTSDLLNDSGFVDAAGAAAAAPVQSVNGQTGDVVLTASDVGALPDTYTAPVSSVNGQTGAVSLSIPDSTSDLINDSGFVDAVGAAAAAPVQSVNGQTGAVVVSGGSAPTLLWTNGSPVSSFNSQTVPLDLSNYSFLLIEFCSKEARPVFTNVYSVPSFEPPVGYTSYDLAFGLLQVSADIKIVRRYLKIATTGVTFYGGVRVDSYNNSNTSDDSVCVPLRIWGVS